MGATQTNLDAVFARRRDRGSRSGKDAWGALSGAIVAGDACRECPGGRRESIEVLASHIGLAHNPLVYFAIADRLGLAEERCCHFDPPVLLRQLYAVHK